MKTLDRGQDKIQKISDELRRETLEPAKKEAEKIIAEAKARAEQIIIDAEKHGRKILEDTRIAIEQERNVFQSSLLQASKQSVEALRQSIDSKLFNQELDKALHKYTIDPNVISNLINALVNAIQKNGVSADFSVIIPNQVSDKQINAMLVDQVLKSLKEKSVVLGDLSGGVQVKLHDKKLTIDMSEQALKDLIARHIRKGFRDLIFQS
jgi:V/A-type H+-transporting ATPase subunit E